MPRTLGTMVFSAHSAPNFSTSFIRLQVAASRMAYTAKHGKDTSVNAHTKINAVGQRHLDTLQSQIFQSMLPDLVHCHIT